MKKVISAATIGLFVSACGQGTGGGGRDEIRVVGSSTVYPFTIAVAEAFARNASGFPSPVVESTGTGAGMKLFCAGVGSQYPDIENASRRMKKSEFDDCQKNGVREIIEIPIGIDGLALIEPKNGAKGFALSVRDVYAALAANPFGKPQTAKTWRDVNPSLPDVAINVYGPPPTSGTRDSFAELFLEKGCDSDPAMKTLKEQDKDQHKDVCTKIREDGAYVEAGENDNLLVQKVAAAPGSIGVLGYSFFEENTDKVKAVPVGGVAPNSQTISALEYPGARQMFIYAKKAHVTAIKGLTEFLAEYKKAIAPGGYLGQRGLIPSNAQTQAQASAAIDNLEVMSGNSL